MMPDKASDKYVRNRVLQLKSDRGACTGVEVKAPSGMIYTLTASHCKVLLADDNTVMSFDEHFKPKKLTMIDIDPDHDLMLMSSADAKSIEVAKQLFRHQKVHTITHGEAHDDYRTDGEVIEETKVMVPLETELKNRLGIQCDQEIPTLFGLVCVKVWSEQMITAQVYPGSSGGPVLNDQGELVGIVSVGEQGTIFGGMVPLRFIHSFLKDR